MFNLWLEEKDWKLTEEAHSVNQKIEIFNTTVLNHVDKCFPKKVIKVTSDDSPWCNSKIRRLKRIKGREYTKNRRSEKWVKMDESYKRVVKEEKTKYYLKSIKYL